MKIQVLSDVHLEFGDLEPARPACDLVVLAGDIHVGTRALRWIERHFQDVPVVYVLGNHEFYGENLTRLHAKIRGESRSANLHVLERGELVVRGVRVLAATMWTDYELEGDVQRAMASAELSMSDFRRIRCGTSYRRLRARDLAGEHRLTRLWLVEAAARPFDGPTIVVTHHAPSRRSIHERYRNNPLNAAYASDLEPLFTAGIDLWIHGHTHVSLDYTVGGTRVVCNPRGYAGEELNPEFRDDLVLEVQPRPAPGAHTAP